MRLLRFFRRSSIGLQVTDRLLRMGVVRREGASIVFPETASLEIPAGIVERGMVKDSAALGRLLRQLRQRLDPKAGTRITICLPAAEVLGSVVRVPSGRRSERTIPRDLVANAIPEVPDEIVVGSSTLKIDPLMDERALLCIRKDILQPYVTACTLAGLSIHSVVTLPMIAAALQGTTDGGIVVASAQGECTATVFAGGWPIDEAIVSDAAALSSEVEALTEDAQKRGRPVSMWAIAGPATLMPALQKIAATDGNHFSVTRLTYPSEKQSEWLGVAGALVTTSAASAFRSALPRRTLPLTLPGLVLIGVGLVTFLAFFLLRSNHGSVPPSVGLSGSSSSALLRSSVSSSVVKTTSSTKAKPSQTSSTASKAAGQGSSAKKR